MCSLGCPIVGGTFVEPRDANRRLAFVPRPRRRITISLMSRFISRGPNDERRGHLIHSGVAHGRRCSQQAAYAKDPHTPSIADHVVRCMCGFNVRSTFSSFRELGYDQGLLLLSEYSPIKQRSPKPTTSFRSLSSGAANSTMSNENVTILVENKERVGARRSTTTCSEASTRNGKASGSSASNSGEENFVRTSCSNKSTQIDFTQQYMRHGQGIANRPSRPTSIGHLPKSNQLNSSNVSIYTPPKNILYASQSEAALSPRNRQTNRYVGLDTIKSIHGQSFNPYPGSHFSGNNAHCNCCCHCHGGQTNQLHSNNHHHHHHHSPHHQQQQQQEDHDGPQGLSWRRLHMSRAKLKATATTSELLSGFAMVAMVELQINEPTAVPEWLFVMFAVCTTVLVSVHIFALMISTYLLPNVEAISKLQISRLVTESPHERMRGFIELAWAFSTVLGLFLFLVEIAILCWVKFWDYSFMAAVASTIIVIPVLIVFVAFAVHFYHSLVVYKCESSTTDMAELENIKKNLDSVSTGQTTV